MSKGFYPQVYALLASIPVGRVATYGDVALALGRPAGGRLVGWAMRRCPEGYPWHRVVNGQGELCTSGRLPDGRLVQQALLEEEGIALDRRGRVDLTRYRWHGAAGG